jgi:hypothetical protein
MSVDATIKTPLTDCLSGESLFQQSNLKPYLNEIKNLVSCPHDLFHSLYVDTLYQLAEFCQAMPLRKQNPDDFSLLKRQLNLCIGALKLRRGIFLPKGANAEKIAMEAPQWTYALFSSVLLHGLYHVAHDRNVSLFHRNHEPAGQWHILCGSLYEKDMSYQVIFCDENKENLSHHITMSSLLSRIIPSMAVRWLSENELLFDYWISIILNDITNDNELWTIINTAKSKFSLPEFNVFKHHTLKKLINLRVMIL